MKIIITGATGFIGRNLAKVFHNKGFDVLATDRSKQMSRELMDAGIIFRPRAVYGKYDNTIVPRILKMSEKGKIPIIGGGNALVDINISKILAISIPVRP